MAVSSSHYLKVLEFELIETQIGGIARHRARSILRHLCHDQQELALAKDRIENLPLLPYPKTRKVTTVV